MAISRTEATQILNEATAAGISEATIEEWTVELGAYRFALTSPNGNPPSRTIATQIRDRIRAHTPVAQQAGSVEPVTPPVSTPSTEMATERQVAYILSLLDQRRRSGEGGGFFQGPTNRQGVERLTRAEATTYIRSLKGDY
ncbi:hypothetical protein OG897_13735 [Streptomyces sp. NBC_00237]|uniref:hypothetical protein n=1 Tax=Streptomyces sp. NBC_00237 TaxID=2975687 RepID=UPI00225A8119|nr:hypothetical protein [Streptomyces sp. NBC_00237]MCX5202505.1 hypothetical protein [Streptomyces sp. NBC_00237]